MDLYALHRNPKIWGDDAEEFRPSRWKEGQDLWEAKWQYAPFLGGIRMCPAQQLVLTQVTYLHVRLAQELREVENRDSVHRYVEEIRMTVESASDLGYWERVSFGNMSLEAWISIAQMHAYACNKASQIGTWAQAGFLQALNTL